ncbi:5'-nucleotidase [Luteococcus sp. Sow4_B9]|uniref:5'-nucleotidase n=1 Tax=Luteococcus sp. Sow4_B9 TaxID=3438792 RepID=UPI003F96E23B
MSTPDLTQALVVGVASSALFDLTESDAIFMARGSEAYEQYQQDHLQNPLQPGPAFPFVKRLLSLNDLHDGLVEVIVMSRNSPTSGLRVMESIAHHELPISRAIFRRGTGSEDFMEAFNMSLFLSANGDDVRRAVESGQPAGQVLKSSPRLETDGNQLRIAFDFDGVLSSDESERIYAEQGIDAYQQSEADQADLPLPAGPMQRFLAAINKIQRLEDELVDKDSTYQRRVRVSLVTARNAPAHKRAIQSIKSWGLQVDDAFFLGGIPKTKVLNVLRPHIFFDDQRRHLTDADLEAPAVHIPFGIRNVTTDTSAPDQEQ